MANFSDWYRRFREWQQQPFSYHDTHGHHECCNCGAESENNYCPRCGQKAVYGPITWHSVGQGILDVWGVGTRSLPYTLWQLVWRPGYLIRDYISGKRQVSFPPVKMLVIVAVVLFFLGRWIFPEFWEQVIEPETEASTETGMLYFLETMGNWFSRHIEWAFLAVFSLLILPMWFVFRYAPNYPRHTLPQGFFVQVFMTVQFLLWLFIGSLVLKLFQVTDVDAIMSAFIFLTMFLVLLIDYHQLFGYGWWGTTWRIVAMVVLLYFFFYFIALPLVLADKVMKADVINWRVLTVKTIGMTTLGFIFCAIVHVINRRLWREGIKKHKKMIILIAAIVTIIVLVDAYLGFKILNSVMRYFKVMTELFVTND